MKKMMELETTALPMEANIRIRPYKRQRFRARQSGILRDRRDTVNRAKRVSILIALIEKDLPAGNPATDALRREMLIGKCSYLMTKRIGGPGCT